ncbi:MAG: glycosyltransferase family 4 protein [Pirellulaceae bacterium]
MIVTRENAIALDSTAAPDVLDGHVVLLTNFVAPHKRPMYVELARRVRQLTVLVSTPMEPNRHWQPDWQDLDVQMLRTATIHQRWRHPAGFTDPAYVHVPWNTVSVLRRLAPDAIIAGELGIRSLLATIYARLVRRTPLVLFAGLSEHTERGRGWSRHLLRRWLIRRADAFAVNGESGARYLQSLGCPPDAITRVFYPTLPGQFDHLPLERAGDRAHHLLFVGQLIERKGVVPFTEALSHWAADHPHRDVRFTLVGAGPEQAALEAIETPANLTLELLGQCGYDRVARAYGEAGIFAFPSLADDWGMAVNEALTAGLPVLGSIYSQAVDELCESGKTGWRFRGDQPQEIDAAIEAALSTPSEQLAAMRVAARERVAPLTPQNAAGRLLAAVRLAMDASPGRRSANSAA